VLNLLKLLPEPSLSTLYSASRIFRFGQLIQTIGYSQIHQYLPHENVQLSPTTIQLTFASMVMITSLLNNLLTNLTCTVTYTV